MPRDPESSNRYVDRTTPSLGEQAMNPFSPLRATTSAAAATGAVTSGGSPSAISYQEPFDARAVRIPLLEGTLQRGYMFQKDPQLAAQGQRSAMGLRFMYNPESVKVGYSLNTEIYPPYAQPQTGQTVPIIGAPGSAQLSFGLLFDRTYDCWGPRRSRSKASQFGVYHDIQQFELMHGYSARSPFVTIVGVQVVFGHDGLKYYGYVTDFNVEYTKWTQDMRPTRCGLNISMQVLPEAQGGVNAREFSQTFAGGAVAYEPTDAAGIPLSASVDSETGRPRSRRDLTEAP